MIRPLPVGTLAEAEIVAGALLRAASVLTFAENSMDKNAMALARARYTDAATRAMNAAAEVVEAIKASPL